MLRAGNQFTVRHPGLMDRIASRMVFFDSYANCRFMPALNGEQQALVTTLKRDGCVVLKGYLAGSLLARMRADLNDALHALEFETPCLAQTRVDPVRHAQLIDNFMYGTPRQLAEWGVSFDRAEACSYEQVVHDFNPSTLTVYMLERSQAFRDVWLDPFILSIVTGYLGMVPKLAEAYVRRNFAAPHRTMNHFWHRDLNTPFHLLKAFFFLSDCSSDTGPHEFVRESHARLDALNDKRYFLDEEVDRIHAPGGRQRVLSVVPAGTVIIEDTRGLHRAHLPRTGYRDLGYATYMPLRPFYPHRNYEFPRVDYDALTRFQKAFVPGTMLV